MQPAIPRERRFLYAGLADRVIHPTRQVMRLYEHWDRPEVHWYQGGHVLFFRAGAAAVRAQGPRAVGVTPAPS